MVRKTLLGTLLVSALSIPTLAAAIPLPATVAAGKAVARNYPKDDPVLSIGNFCEKQSLTGNLCVFGASAKSWDTAFTRSGFSTKDTIANITKRGPMALIEYDVIGMSEILLPFLSLTDTPGGMQFLVDEGMINQSDVSDFMALTGKSAGKLTGATKSPQKRATAQETVYKFSCGKKTLSLYENSAALFVEKSKADDLEIRNVTDGAVVNFREYAEMGGSYTQYQMSIFNGKAKLSSQWLTADGDPRRAADVVDCTILDPIKGTMPSIKSTMEKIRAGELD